MSFSVIVLICFTVILLRFDLAISFVNCPFYIGIVGNLLIDYNSLHTVYMNTFLTFVSVAYL